MKIKNHFSKYWISKFFGEKIYNHIKYHVSIRKYVSSSSILKEITFRGDTVLDIGANIGGTTYIFSKSCARGGKVYSFEPNEMAYSFLLKTIKKYKLDNVSSFNLAISDSKKKTKLAVPSFDKLVADTRSTIDEKTINLYSEEENITNLIMQSVVCESIDNFVMSNDLKIDFIKEDTEGHTEDIIVGGMKTISKFLPTLYLEYPQTGPIIKKMESMGYILFNDLGNGKIKTFSSLTNDEKTDNNSLLIHKTRLSKFEKIIF